MGCRTAPKVPFAGRASLVLTMLAPTNEGNCGVVGRGSGRVTLFVSPIVLVP